MTWAGLEAVRQGLPGLRWAAWMRAAFFARVCGRCWWALVAFFGLATLASLRALGQERMPLRGATLDRLGYAVVVLFHLILPVRPPVAVWTLINGLVHALLHVLTTLPVADAAACSTAHPPTSCLRSQSGACVLLPVIYQVCFSVTIQDPRKAAVCQAL